SSPTLIPACSTTARGSVIWRLGDRRVKPRLRFTRLGMSKEYRSRVVATAGGGGSLSTFGRRAAVRTPSTSESPARNGQEPLAATLEPQAAFAWDRQLPLRS